MKSLNVGFYIGWLEKFNKLWLTTQLSQIIEVYNESFSKRLFINGKYFIFKKIKKELLRNNQWLSTTFSIWREIIEVCIFADIYISNINDIISYLKRLESSNNVLNIIENIKWLPDLTIQKIAWYLEMSNWSKETILKIMSIRKRHYQNNISI